MQRSGGFVAGTLVHTKQGRRPIGMIKEGDLVLTHSDPSVDQARVFMRVTSVHSFLEREVMQFCWHWHDGKGGDGNFDHAFSTPNALVWSRPQGWVPIGRVPYTSEGGDEWFGRNLVLVNESLWGERYEINSVYRTKNSEIGYVHCDSWGSGNYVDLSMAPYKFLNDEEHEPESWRAEQDSDEWKIYATRVIHLEVEASHTFFVGSSGLLVHDASWSHAAIPMNLIDRDY